MKKLFVIEDTTENKISYYHLAAFLIALPFDRSFSELILVSFLLHTIIHITKKKLRNAFNLNIVVLSSFFFITVIGLIYSHDRAEGLKDLEKRLAVLFFPILLSICGLDLKKHLLNLLLLFSFTCTVTILYLYFDALHIILYNKLPVSTLFTKAFINHNFSEPIGLHATYLAIYSLLSVTILFYSALHTAITKHKTIYFVSILILLAGLVQLASRSVLISGIVIAACFPFFTVKRKGRLRFIRDLFSILVLAGLLIMNISSFKMRYVAQFREDLTQQSINNEILEPRIVRWKYILPEIRKSPFVGHGSGSEQRILNGIYFENKLYNSYLHELNAHNQYLSVLLETGMWGLIAFLFTLFAGFRAAIRQKNILFLGFLIVVCIVSFSENMLDVNKGIFFYSFFFSLFALPGKPFNSLFRLKIKGEQSAFKEE